MSVDLEHQIGNLFDEIQGGQTPVTIDEITALRLGAEPVRPLAPLAHPATPRQGWLGAVAAAVAVLVLVGGAALLFRVIGSDTPVATTPPTVPLSSLTWSQVPYDEAAFGGAGGREMAGVTAGGPGLVAVGHEWTGALAGADAAVWTSPDGITWSRVPDDEAVLGGLGEQGMWSVTAGGPGLVAVGSDGLDAAVWTSPDGITWSRVPHDEAVFGGEGEQQMGSVTAGGPGLVAVGHDGSGGEGDAAVWTSSDGITWSRVPHDEAVFGGEGEQHMGSVTAGGPGLVAVGGAGQHDGPNAAVWTSPDGITWSRVPHDEAVFGGEQGDQRMDGVTVGGPGLVAVGQEGTARAADGRVLTFTLVDDETFTDEETGTLWNMLGLGIEGPLEGTQLVLDGHAAVWTSPDGITWSRVPHDEAVFGGEGFQEMDGVTAGGPGLVAVGGNQDAAVWTSPDGITWSRVPHDEAVFGGAGDQGMVGVTFGGPGLVAVGFDDVGAAVWVAAREE